MIGFEIPFLLRFFVGHPRNALRGSSFDAADRRETDQSPWRPRHAWFGSICLCQWWILSPVTSERHWGKFRLAKKQLEVKRRQYRISVKALGRVAHRAFRTAVDLR